MNDSSDPENVCYGTVADCARLVLAIVRDGGRT
jgi:hypothetical protein